MPQAAQIGGSVSVLRAFRQRDKDESLGALAANAQHPVAVLLAEVGDVRAGGLEDPQAEWPEHGHQREMLARFADSRAAVSRRFELQVGEAERG